MADEYEAMFEGLNLVPEMTNGACIREMSDAELADLLLALMAIKGTGSCKDCNDQLYCAMMRLGAGQWPNEARCKELLVQKLQEPAYDDLITAIIEL